MRILAVFFPRNLPIPLQDLLYSHATTDAHAADLHHAFGIIDEPQYNDGPMRPGSVPEATEIYTRLRQGDRVASNAMFELVYTELRQLAHQHLRGESGCESLQTTMLVHEAYIRLVGRDQDWDGRAHFFGAAAEAMRRILVDRARARQALKRGKDWKQVELDRPIVDATSPPDEILIVNDAFDQLADKYPREAEVAKLRYFAGMNLSEVAHALDMSISSAHRSWTFARAWLIRTMTGESSLPS